ncbi:protein O-mannosyl-transferase Tmtc2-like [Planococcus citri]|uniref:protein O-mannosyl-transferase Tmtc2-like n=1 Tax=Planococcus citri TaxID=170843 RepID=UPI0031F76FF9
MGLWTLTSCTLAALVYANTLQGTFVYDDRRAILSNQDTNSNNPAGSLWTNDFWGTPLKSGGSHGSYRPLTVLTYRWNHWLSGYNAWSYHLTNVALHVTMTGLVYHLGTLLMSKTAAGFASVVFAVHPIHTEAVASIVGRADILAGVLVMASITLYIKYREIYNYEDDWRDEASKSKSPKHKKNRKHYYEFVSEKTGRNFKTDCTSNNAEVMVKKYAYLMLTLVCATLAIFSKEPGYAALPICMVYEVLMMARVKIIKFQTKLRWTNLLILCSVSTLLLSVRLKLANFNMPTFSSADNPIIKSNFETRALTFAYLPVFNFFLTLFPFSLSFDWGMDSIPRITSLLDYRNLLSIGFYLISQLILRWNFVKFVQDKIKHDPECGNEYSCFCKHVISQKSLTPPAILLFVISISVIPFIPATNLFFYVGFVVAERVLYIPSVGLCLLVGYCYDNVPSRRKKLFKMAVLLSVAVFGVRSVLRNDDWQTEEKLYRSNIHINPPKAYGNLGCVLSSEGRLQEAEEALRKALRYRYNMADVHYNLASLLEETSRQEEAIVRYNAAIKYRPSLINAYLRLGQLLTATGRDFEAIAILTKGLKVDISHSKDVKVNELARIESLIKLASIYVEGDDLIQGLTTYVEAVATAPSYYKPQALFVYIGETLVKMKNYEDADKWYQYITGDQPGIRPKEIIGLKSFTNCTKSMKKKWIKAMETFNFKDPSLYLQYSQLLINDNKYRKAVDILRKVLEDKPNDHQLMLKTARICRLAGFLDEAELYLRKLVLIKPDANSFHELAAVLKLAGKAEEAVVTFRYAEQLKLAAQKSLVRQQQEQQQQQQRNCDTNDTEDRRN